MRQAVILSAVRTPLGKFGGQLASRTAPELGAIAVRAAVARAGLDPGLIDEVILGNVLQGGLGQAPARQAALRGGLPDTVAALTINKVCGSGLKAVLLAAQAIRAGDADFVVAGGMESMSAAPRLLARALPATGPLQLVDSLLSDGLTCAFSGASMGQLAERTAARYGVTRAQQDAYALESHRRAIAAHDAGWFRNEIVPVDVAAGTGGVSAVASVGEDEGPRRDACLDRLSRLKPAFADSGTITPGNASLISDGAAALVVADAAAAAAQGIPARARILAGATTGVPPEEVFLAPVAAVRSVVLKAGLSLSDVDLFEINEAFAAQMVACLRELELPADRVNVHGGAVALGHPIGCSGARTLVTLLSALEHRNLRRGVAALCLGGGNAVALLLERIDSRDERASRTVAG